MDVVTFDPDLGLLKEIEAHLSLFKDIKKNSYNALTTIDTDKLQRIMELALVQLKLQKYGIRVPLDKEKSNYNVVGVKFCNE